MLSKNKAAARKVAKTRRAELARSLPDADLALIENFPNLEISGRKIAGYIPIASEISPISLLRNLEARGAKLCLPRISPITSTINFHQFGFDDELEQGDMGIFEPNASMPIISPDIILVPFLAFDNNGFRLGYGGGYYDKALAILRTQKPIITIGIGFDGQRIEKLPVEPHDERLDYIMTEASLYDFTNLKVLS